MKTKFKLKELVFFMDKNRVRSGNVIEVRLTSSRDNKPYSEVYVIERVTYSKEGNVTLPVEKMFFSKEDLINSL